MVVGQRVVGVSIQLWKTGQKITLKKILMAPLRVLYLTFHEVKAGVKVLTLMTSDL